MSLGRNSDEVLSKQLKEVFCNCRSKYFFSKTYSQNGVPKKPEIAPVDAPIIVPPIALTIVPDACGLCNHPVLQKKFRCYPNQ